MTWYFASFLFQIVDPMTFVMEEKVKWCHRNMQLGTNGENKWRKEKRVFNEQ